MDRQLLEYIQNARTTGQTDEQIKNALRSAGWLEESIANAFQPIDNQGIHYASFLKRFLAFILDDLFIPIVILISIRISLGFIMPRFPEFIPYLLLIVLQLWNKVYLLGTTGRTIGKRLLGITVLRLDSLIPPGMPRAFIRETVGKFLSQIFLGLGFLMPLWDKRKQAVHDKLVGTIVVRLIK